MKNSLIIFFLFNLIFFTLSERSLAFRCGNNIVDRGDTTVDLLSKCGKPEKKEYTYEKINDQLLPIENWLYDCGESSFIYVLSISNSKIIKENTLKRGTYPKTCK